MPGKVTEIFFKEGCSEDFLISAKWTSQGLNLGPPDYESVALTN